MAWNHTLPWSRVRRRLAPFFLPFVPCVTDVREWNVEIKPIATKLWRALPLSGTLKVSLHRLLIESGIALTPAESSWDPRSWFALYRYGSDFIGTSPKLRFYAGVQEKDPRLTAVASEEVSIGITCYILREHFGLVHIADAYACLTAGELAYVGATFERPDYFCEDLLGATVLAESKGATGTRCSITKRINPEGLAQVKNVQPTNRPLRSSCGRVVIGTYVCVDGIHPRSETTTIIEDPDGIPSQEKNPESDKLMRLAYAKVLRFCGKNTLAEILLQPEGGTNTSAIGLSSMLTVMQTKVLRVGFTPLGDAVFLYGPTAEALFSQNTPSVRTSVQKSLQSFFEHRNKFDHVGYTLSNGIIIIHNEKNMEYKESANG